MIGTRTTDACIRRCERWPTAARATRLMSDAYTPRPEDKFSFGLWTVGKRGRDPFGDVVRDALAPAAAVAVLGEGGARGGNPHDNDLVAIDATPSERGAIATDFTCACGRPGIGFAMASVNLSFGPA